MERPFCPLCKTKHFAREGCSFKDAAPQTESRIITEQSGQASANAVAAPSKIPRKEGLGVCPACGQSHRAYMKKYMKLYRARLKEKLP
jgi:hypothetical protein